MTWWDVVGGLGRVLGTSSYLCILDMIYVISRLYTGERCLLSGCSGVE